MIRRNLIRLLALQIIMLGLFAGRAAAQTISYGSAQTYTAERGISTLAPTINFTPAINAYTTTLAGSGMSGSANGTGIAASFNRPVGIAVDALGNVYLAENTNNDIRKITPAGVVTTFVGSGIFSTPNGIAIDALGNLYVADVLNNKIRMVTSAGVVSTLAGTGTQGNTNGAATSVATFNQPTGVAVDASGNVYVGDTNNNLIRKIAPDGTVTTLAGSGAASSVDGKGIAASFKSPCGLVIDGSGNLFVADKGGDKIRKITPDGTVTTIAGSGTVGSANSTTGTSATFNYPHALAADAAGNLYVADQQNDLIRMITPAGVVSTVAGVAGTASAINGTGSGATMNNPFAITIDASGYLYIADYNNFLVRKVAMAYFGISPELPQGLNFNTMTGEISGTPAVALTATTYTITGYAATGSNYAATTLSLTVNAAPAVTLSSSQNYVSMYTPRVSGLMSSSAVVGASMNNTQVETSVQYFDGLGRPLQSVQVKGSPNGRDMVQPYAYDALGREVTKYLPYAPSTAADGSYKSDALTTGSGQSAFYTSPPSGVSTDTYPVAEVALEPSPLNRVLEHGAPGDNWQLTAKVGPSSPGHTVKMSYVFNNNIDWATDNVNSMQVALYTATVNPNGSRALTRGSSYAATYDANQLYVTVTQDENWTSGRAGTVEEYKDKAGHVVLKRIYNLTSGGVLQQLSTYYVYDDKGQLAFVLPPGANPDAAAQVIQATLNNFCYQYRYDERGRLTQKKIPGKGWDFAIFNYIDETVATQDSLQRNQNNWIFSKYDVLGRPVLSGLWNNANMAVSQASLQTTLTGITTNLWEASVNTGNGYTNTAWPTTSVTATLSSTYFDTYANIPGLPATYTLNSGISQMTRGLATVKKKSVLNTPADQLWDVIYYDDLGRPSKAYTQHYLGGTANTNNYDLVTTAYNFTNVPTKVIRQHWTSGSTTVPLVTIVNSYIYDHMGRKLKSWEQISSGYTPTTKTLLSKMDYNEIGQLLNKHLHSLDSLNFLQNIAYAYNERGWLKSMNTPASVSASQVFGEQLQYNDGPSPQYNGNISGMLWQTMVPPGLGLTQQQQSYAYTYERLNRLTLANYTTTGSAGKFNEAVSYDVMGNITGLQRTATTTAGQYLNNFTYDYTSQGAGNRLYGVTDGGTAAQGSTYAYDGNGNMISDSRNQVTNITYNLLNLPQAVTRTPGNMSYIYDAAGMKLEKISGGITRDYIGGIEYNNGSIEFVTTDEGRARPSGSNYIYEYYLKDHLGNIRAAVRQDGTIGQVQDYYAFGLEMGSSVTPSPANQYKYADKEKQPETGEIDFGARDYDPIIARWTTVDPLAEISKKWSVYAYAMDNPIRLIDPDGMYTVDLMGHTEGEDDKNIDVNEQQREKFENDTTKKAKACCTAQADGVKNNTNMTAIAKSKYKAKHKLTAKEILAILKTERSLYGLIKGAPGAASAEYGLFIADLLSSAGNREEGIKKLKEFIGDKALSAVLKYGSEGAESGFSVVSIVYDYYNNTALGTKEMADSMYVEYSEARRQQEIPGNDFIMWDKRAKNYWDLYQQYSEKYQNILEGNDE